MSRLSGWVDFNHRSDRNEAQLLAMLEAMQCIGENTCVTWLDNEAALGRISFSASPGRSEEIAIVGEAGSRTAATYAGSIYNLDALKAKLAAAGVHPSSEASGQLLALAFRVYGPEFAAMLEGGFAIAIYDEREKQLCLVRDRLGIQPLYVHRNGGSVTFSSVLTSFWKDPKFSAKVDADLVSILLQPRLARPGEVPIADVDEVAPASALLINADRSREVCYWSLTSAAHKLSFEDTARHTRDLLDTAVAKRLPECKNICSMLSGGLDSTSVTALAKQHVDRAGKDQIVNTYCLDFGGSENGFRPTSLRPNIDAPFAIQAAEFIGTNHKSLVTSVEEMLSVLPQTFRARGLPGWGQFDASMLLLFRKMSESNSAGVTGECADEIFGGYPHFFNNKLIDRPTFPWLPDIARLGYYLVPSLQNGFDPIEDEKDRYAKMIEEVPQLDGECLQEARYREVFYVTLGGRLAVLLDRMDRMSMLFGIQMHLPFCDTELWEFAWNTPWAIKTQGGQKGVLKHAMQDILPDSTLNRKKSAYPEVQNNVYNRFLIKNAKEILGDPNAASHGLFDRQKMGQLVSELESGSGAHNAEHVLIQYIDVEKWMEEFKVSL